MSARCHCTEDSKESYNSRYMVLTQSSSMGISSWDHLGASGNVAPSDMGTLSSITPLMCSKVEVTYGSKESGYLKIFIVESSSLMSLSATRHIANAFSRSLALSDDREVSETDATHLIVKR